VVYLWWILVVLGIVVGIAVIVGIVVIVVIVGIEWRRKSKKEPNRRDNDRFTGW